MNRFTKSRGMTRRGRKTANRSIPNASATNEQIPIGIITGPPARMMPQRSEGMVWGVGRASGPTISLPEAAGAVAGGWAMTNAEPQQASASHAPISPTSTRKWRVPRGRCFVVTSLAPQRSGRTHTHARPADSFTRESVVTNCPGTISVYPAARFRAASSFSFALPVNS